MSHASFCPTVQAVTELQRGWMEPNANIAAAGAPTGSELEQTTARFAQVGNQDMAQLRALIRSYLPDEDNADTPANASANLGALLVYRTKQKRNQAVAHRTYERHGGGEEVLWGPGLG
jgi:hypothetical protein